MIFKKHCDWIIFLQVPSSSGRPVKPRYLYSSNFCAYTVYRLYTVYAFPRMIYHQSNCTLIRSNLFNTDTKGTQPSVRFTEVSVL